MVKKVAEFVAREVGDFDTLADLAAAEFWKNVTAERVSEHAATAASQGHTDWFTWAYSRLAAHRPELVSHFRQAAQRHGISLPTAPDPIPHLRSALNAFRLSQDGLAAVGRMQSEQAAPHSSFLSDVLHAMPPPDARQVAYFLAPTSVWGELRAAEMPLTLDYAVRIGTPAVEWLGNVIYFYRRDLFSALRRAAAKLDRKSQSNGMRKRA